MFEHFEENMFQDNKFLKKNTLFSRTKACEIDDNKYEVKLQ